MNVLHVVGARPNFMKGAPVHRALAVRGVNQAIAECQADRVLIMNPDCQLMPGSLRLLMDALDSDVQCAVVAPRILDPDGAPQGNARGDPDMLTGLFGRTSALRRLLPGLQVAQRNVVDDSNAGGSMKVDWVSGACILARREALTAVGGFDERYFMYMEDGDFCAAIRACGRKILFTPTAEIVHLRGRSAATSPGATRAAYERSHLAFYEKHYPRLARFVRMYRGGASLPMRPV